MNYFDIYPVACKSDAIHCMYLPVKDRLVFWDEHRVGVRKDLSGVMLLDTALQASITKTEAPVCVELPLAEVRHIQIADVKFISISHHRYFFYTILFI